MLTLVRAAALLILSSFAVGCVVPRYNYFPTRAEISEPPLGVIRIAQLGDNMLRQGHYTEHDALYLFRDTAISWAYTARQGYYLKKGENEDSEFFLPSNEPEGGQIIKAAIADNWISLQAYKQEQRLCMITIANVHACESDTRLSAEDDQFCRAIPFSKLSFTTAKWETK